jgi:hypothetical protein
MEKPREKEPHLIIHASLPIRTIPEGEEIYEQLKHILLEYSARCTMDAQIIEPCCKKQEKGTPNANNSKMA